MNYPEFIMIHKKCIYVVFTNNVTSAIHYEKSRYLNIYKIKDRKISSTTVPNL